MLCSDYQQPITRAEFAQLLEILVSSIPQDNVPYRYPGMFKDIAESPNWFSIVYCTSRGLFAGTSETTFSPDGTLTREQAAKLLCTLLDFFRVAADEQTQVAPFADADAISGWAVQFVDRAVRGGLMQGDGERFDPQAPVSREMAAVLLERVFVRFLEPLKAAVEPAA
ncbi:MAG: S-layer homology domain-containing protein [Oscillospiraceae bacterium]|nr:S-layer homology domain-containing protein [Oscillospiraceae bacterium]